MRQSLPMITTAGDEPSGQPALHRLRPLNLRETHNPTVTKATTMSAITPRTWNETDIPTVVAADLTAALSLWLARERSGLVLVADAQPATRVTIEAAVMAKFDHPADGLAVVLRMRGLIEALAARRLRHLIRAAHAADLARLVAIAAGQRLNPRWGMSTVRLAWALAATETHETTRKAA